MFGKTKTSKKIPKSSRRHISLGIPTNIAVGPLGFRADLDIGPKGEQNCPYRGLKTDRADLTAVLDDKDPRTSRIIFQDKKGEDQGLPVAGTSIHGITVNMSNPEDSPPSKYFCSLLLFQTFMRISSLVRGGR